jgi:hypothetical protein
MGLFISWGIVFLVIAAMYTDGIVKAVRDLFGGLANVRAPFLAVFAQIPVILHTFANLVYMIVVWIWAHTLDAYMMAVGGWVARWLDYGAEGRRHRSRNLDETATVTVAHLLTGMDVDHPYIVPTRHSVDRSVEDDAEVDLSRWNGADEEFIELLHDMNLVGVGIHGDASL